MVKEDECLEYVVGDKVSCPFIRSDEGKEDAVTAVGTILCTRIVTEKSIDIMKYYIHFDGKDKRHDRWVKDDYLSRAEVNK